MQIIFMQSEVLLLIHMLFDVLCTGKYLVLYLSVLKIEITMYNI